MLLKITTWAGHKLDGALLVVSGPMMRVAISGYDDAVEFRLRGGQWFSADGEFVEIEWRGTEDSLSPASGNRSLSRSAFPAWDARWHWC